MQEWIKHNDTGQKVHMPTAILTCESLLKSLRKNCEEIDEEVFGNIMRDMPPHYVFEALVMGLQQAMEAVAEEFTEEARVGYMDGDEDLHPQRENNEDGS